MDTPIVQIYEIQEPAEAEVLVAMGVDRIGSVILHRDEWRVPTIWEVVEVTRGTTTRTNIIPLFGCLDTICRAIDYYRPDYVHFCEALSPFSQDAEETRRRVGELVERQRAVRERFPDVGIVRSLSVPRPGDGAIEEMTARILTIASPFVAVTDEFLLDTYLAGSVSAQPVSGYVGVTGLTLNWDIAACVVAACPRRVVLAGGLSGENVFAAVRRVKPWGVDSCTMTNAVDDGGRPVRFRKDLEKVRLFLDEARRATLLDI